MKKIKKALIIVFVLMFFLYFLLIFRTKPKSSLSPEAKKKVSIYEKEIELFDDFENTANIFATNTWIVNSRILQYSTVISFDENRTIEIESLAIVNYDNLTKTHDNITCVIKMGNILIVKKHDYMIGHGIMGTKYGAPAVFRFKCFLLNDYTSLIDKIHVAIVDSRNYDNIRQNVSNILFHKPDVFSKLKPKKSYHKLYTYGK